MHSRLIYCNLWCELFEALGVRTLNIALAAHILALMILLESCSDSTSRNWLTMVSVHDYSVSRIMHHVVGLYQWSKKPYFEFFIVLLNPFWYYCPLFPCYSTVVPYYCPLLPCYSTLRPYYLPFLSCYSTLLACYSTVRSSYITLILLLSLSSHDC